MYGVALGPFFVTLFPTQLVVRTLEPKNTTKHKLVKKIKKNQKKKTYLGLDASSGLVLVAAHNNLPYTFKTESKINNQKEVS